MEALLNKLERQWGQWAIPGLIRYLAILFVGVFLASAIRPSFTASLDFNYAKILEGEYWRLVSFIFAPQIGSFSPLALIFLVFGTMILFAFSDALEAQWGVFRTNLYILAGFVSTLAFNLIYAIAFWAQFPMTGIFLGASILFAFALYNPRFTINLFMIIPCPIWIIAVISGVGLLMGKLYHPLALLHSLGCLANFLVVAGIHFTQKSRQSAGSAIRKKKFSRQFQGAKQEAFHTCHACGATDISHPEREFRVAADGNDYCDEHLPKN